LLREEEEFQTWRVLRERGRRLVHSKRYSKRIDNILREGRKLLNKMKNDPITNKLSEDTQKLAQDLMLDSEGKPSLSKIRHSVSQLRALIVPAIQKHLEMIPIPRIEGSNDQYDYWIDNLNFSGYDIIPEHIHMSFNEDLDFNTKKLALENAKAFLDFKINNIHVALKDVGFYFRLKSFPRLEDSGIADISVSGEGTAIEIKWRVESHGEEPFRFSVEQVVCHVQNLKINTKLAYHEVLLNVLSKLFAGTTKLHIEHYVRDSIKNLACMLNERLNQVARESFYAQTQTR